MAYYRLHFMKLGRIAHSYEFHAVDDSEAIKFASVWIEDAPMELWRDQVLIQRWPSRS